MGTCASAPTAPAPLDSPSSDAKPPPLRIPSALRNPARLADKSFGSTISLVRSSFTKLQDKIQMRMETAASLRATAETSALLIPPDQGDTIISFRASELVSMVDTILYLLDSQQLKKAANQDSAASANLDTLRMLGETAGRVRRKSSVGRSGLTVTDKDIANYVLDEFASVQQLSAADVQALNDAAAKRAAGKKHRRSSGFEESTPAKSPGVIAPNDIDSNSKRSAAGSPSRESKSVDTARAASPTAEGSNPQSSGTGDIDRTEEDSVNLAVSGPEAIEATGKESATVISGSGGSQDPHQGVAVLSGATPGSPGLAFRKGRQALARLVTVTGRIASDAVERHIAHSADLLEQIAPTLSSDQIDAVLAVTGDNSGWDLDALAVEEVISFPSGITAARLAATESALRVSPVGSNDHDGGGCEGGDDDDLGLLAAAARASPSHHSSRRIAALAHESLIGAAGSGGDDGLLGVPRLALPFIGAMLLRRHGFILGASDTSSPRGGGLPTVGAVSLTAISMASTPDAAAGAAAATASVAAAAVTAAEGVPAMTLELQEDTVVRFLRRLSDGYRSNPYHNATHALDVMHSAHSIALSPHLLGVIKREHKLAMLLGAAVHDYRHDGLNNALHMKLRSPLSLRYNDQSVLENMHIAEAYALMATPDEDLDVMGDLGYEASVAVRSAMVQMVLATDMRFHFQALEDFEVNVLPIVRSYHAEAVNVMSEARAQRRRAAANQTASQRKTDARLSDSRRNMRDAVGGVSITPRATAGDDEHKSDGGLWLSYASERSDGDASSTSPRAAGRGGGSSAGGADLTSPASHSEQGGGCEDLGGDASGSSRYHFGGAVGAVPGKRQARLSVVSAPVAELQAHSMVIAKLTMHAADVSNPVKELATYRKWAARCMAEFYHIGDTEKAAGLTPSTFFDRDARNMPKCQIGFISFIVRPLFAALSELVTDHAANWKMALDTNQAYFESALSDGAVDDAHVDGDWFEDDPSSAREGALPQNPFLPLD